MAIYTRFGTPCKLVTPIDSDSGECGVECYYTTRTTYREVHVSQLKADDGFREINAASCDLEQRYKNLEYAINHSTSKIKNNSEWLKGLYLLEGFNDTDHTWTINKFGKILWIVKMLMDVRYYLHQKGFVWVSKSGSWMYKGDVR